MFSIINLSIDPYRDGLRPYAVRSGVSPSALRPTFRRMYLTDLPACHWQRGCNRDEEQMPADANCEHRLDSAGTGEAAPSETAASQPKHRAFLTTVHTTNASVRPPSARPPMVRTQMWSV